MVSSSHMTTPKQISTYLFIAAFAAVNAWYFGFRKTQHSGYSIINGAEIVSIERADSSQPDRYFPLTVVICRR